MTKPASLPDAINKHFRGTTDAWRSAFLLTRYLRDPRRFAAARRVARRSHAPADIAVDPARGYRIFPPGTFAEADELVAAARQLLGSSQAEEILEQRKGGGRKKFLINLLDRATLTDAHPAVRLALRPDVLAAVVGYMQTVPVLRSIQVFYSANQDRRPTSSQLYHCDSDDRRQFKIFVLCSDVTPHNGPTMILDATRSAAVRRARGYRYHESLTDEEVAAVAGTDPAAPVIGPAGTVCFVDTSRCFHFGARVERDAAPRLVAMIQYLSPWSFVRPAAGSGACVTTPPAGVLSPLQRTVLTGDYGQLR